MSQNQENKPTSTSNIKDKNTTDQSATNKNKKKTSQNNTKKKTETNKNTVNKTASLTFAVIGDTQYSFKCELKSFQSAIGQISKQNPDLAFVVGDLIQYKPTNQDYLTALKKWKKIASSIISKTYPAVGNHDLPGSAVSNFVWSDSFNLPQNGPKNYSERVYSFNLKTAHFIILDTITPKPYRISPKELDWLKSDLSKNNKKNIFIFYHVPAFSVAIDSASKPMTLDTDIVSRNKFWKIVDDYKVAAVFSGHEHYFSRRLINNKVIVGAKNPVYQFIVGKTGAQQPCLPDPRLSDFIYRDYHFLIVKINNNIIQTNLYSTSGKFINTFSFKNKKT